MTKGRGRPKKKTVKSVECGLRGELREWGEWGRGFGGEV